MDLTTTYLGLRLRSPLVASASPLAQTVDGVRELDDAGVGAIVLHSLFEEQVRREEVEDLRVSELHDETFGEARSYFPEAPTLGYGGSAPYLAHLERAVAASGVPVIASLNGSSRGGWTGIARSMESAGAAAIELNVYAVPDLRVSGAAVEQRHVDVLHAVKDVVSVPVAVKLSPWLSSTGATCLELDRAGADGLVLFNRFLQPDIDVERLVVEPAVSLSSPAESRLPRTWVAMLHGRVRASLAGTTGVETGEDVAKYLLAGADVVMTASALLRHGRSHAARLIADLEEWLSRKGFGSLAEVRGLLAVGPDVELTSYERAGYVTALRRARETYGSFRVD
jgi:dihydroorotate dehydrogenase (fumarate)